MAKKIYLAYGSNLNKAQMALRCPGAKPLGRYALDGYELLFKGSQSGAYLTIEEAEGGVVYLGAWEVTAEHEIALDRYEGYPHFYYKTTVSLTGQNGEQLEGFIYIMHEERELGTPSAAYVKVCLDGFRDFGFDKRHIYDAIERSKEAKP